MRALDSRALEGARAPIPASSTEASSEYLKAPAQVGWNSQGADGPGRQPRASNRFLTILLRALGAWST
jgi:hypothetical protein